MNVIVLTRTSNRPRAFARLRESLQSQRGVNVIHVVHSDTPSDSYVTGDIVVRGERLHRDPLNTAPWERYNARLFDAIAQNGLYGAVTFIDDDDVYAHEESLLRVACETQPGLMTLWKVQRENGRISPFVWQGDLSSLEGRVCWEAGTFHTANLLDAAMVKIDTQDGGDGRFWLGLSRRLGVKWVDEVITKPQGGKGHGRRKDV